MPAEQNPHVVRLGEDRFDLTKGPEEIARAQQALWDLMEASGSEVIQESTSEHSIPPALEQRLALPADEMLTRLDERRANRARSAMCRQGIFTVGDLIAYDGVSLRMVLRLGEKAVEVIEENLASGFPPLALKERETFKKSPSDRWPELR